MTRREKRELEKKQQENKSKEWVSKASAFFKKPTFIKVSAVVLASIVFLVSAGFFVDSFAPANPKCYHRWVLSAFNGSYNAKGKPQTYMQLETQANIENGKSAITYLWAQTSVTNGAGIKEIWINVSDLYEEEVKVKIGTGKSEYSSTFLKEYSLTKSIVKKSSDGWIKIYDCGQKEDEGKDGFDKVHTSNINPTFRVGFDRQIRVREIAFVGRKGNGVLIKDFGVAMDDDKSTPSANTESEVYKAFDEQTTFPFYVEEEF